MKRSLPGPEDSETIAVLLAAVTELAEGTAAEHLAAAEGSRTPGSPAAAWAPGLVHRVQTALQPEIDALAAAVTGKLSARHLV